MAPVATDKGQETGQRTGQNGQTTLNGMLEPQGFPAMPGPRWAKSQDSLTSFL